MSLTVDIWDYVLSNESIRSVSALRAIPISFYEMFIYLHPRMSFFSKIQIDVLQMAKSVDAHVLVAFKFGAVMLTWMTYPCISFYNKYYYFTYNTHGIYLMVYAIRVRLH